MDWISTFSIDQPAQMDQSTNIANPFHPYKITIDGLGILCVELSGLFSHFTPSGHLVTNVPPLPVEAETVPHPNARVCGEHSQDPKCEWERFANKLNEAKRQDDEQRWQAAEENVRFAGPGHQKTLWHLIDTSHPMDLAEVLKIMGQKHGAMLHKLILDVKSREFRQSPQTNTPAAKRPLDIYTIGNYQGISEDLRLELGFNTVPKMSVAESRPRTVRVLSSPSEEPESERHPRNSSSIDDNGLSEERIVEWL